MKNDNCALLERLQMTRGNEWPRKESPAQRRTDIVTPVALNHTVTNRMQASLRDHRHLVQSLVKKRSQEHHQIIYHSGI